MAGHMPPHWTVPLSAKTGCKIRCRIASMALLGVGMMWYLAGPGKDFRGGPDESSIAPRRLSTRGLGDDGGEEHGDNDLYMVDWSHLTSQSCPVPGTVCIKPGSRWLLAFYFFGIAYMFVALAIVCDEFFVPSLEAFVDKFGISMDVAGATFMAAGGSMPELFTSFIGTFERSDIGFATIVGSAVFNVLFVIGVCAMASKEPLQLSAWPLARDCVCYLIGLVTVVIFFVGTSPGKIDLWEAIILLTEYVGYCVLMKFNTQLHMFARRLVRADSAGTAHEMSMPAGDCSVRSNRHFTQPSAFRTGIVEMLKENASALDTAGIAAVTQVAGNLKETFDKLDADGSGFIDDWELEKLLQSLGCSDSRHAASAAMSISRSCDSKISFDDFKKWYLVSEARIEIEVRRVFESLDQDGDGTVGPQEICRLLQNLGLHTDEAEAARAIEDILRLQPHGDDESHSSEDSADPSRESACTQARAHVSGITFQQFRRWYNHSLFWQEKRQGGESEAQESFSIEIPEGSSWPELLWYVMTYPLCAAFYVTMPDVRRTKRRGSLAYTSLEFVLCLSWIAFFSFCMLDWVEVSSNTLGIPTPIAGVTVLAAGTSVPDLLSSYIVARHGEGDMAVSSSIGSNIFDILVGLALPWLCFNLVYGEPVHVKTVSLGFSILVLISMLLAVLATVICMGWRMTKQLGFIMFLLYAVFMVQDILQQYPAGHPVLTPIKF